MIRIPSPEKCALVQMLIADTISHHRDGLSWDGEFNLDDVVLYDDRVFIARKPKSFRVRPNISPEMVGAMEKDFYRISCAVLCKFKRPRGRIPFLITYINLLTGVSKSYPGCWSNTARAKAMRELIEHYPFLKPAMARSNLYSGIFTACRSHDEGDKTAVFKSMLHDSYSQWVGRQNLLSNRMTRRVFRHKDQIIEPAGDQIIEPTAADQTPAAADQTPAAADQTIEPATEGPTPAGTEAARETSTLGYYYEENHELMFEFLRHLGHHGSGYSFEYRPPDERVGPRKQLLQSLDETEIAGAINVEGDVEQALALLLLNSAMEGLYDSLLVFLPLIFFGVCILSFDQ